MQRVAGLVCSRVSSLAPGKNQHGIARYASFRSSRVQDPGSSGCLPRDFEKSIVSPEIGKGIDLWISLKLPLHVVGEIEEDASHGESSFFSKFSRYPFDF